MVPLFEKVFANLHENNREIKVLCVWGKDGLELERKQFSAADDLDLELIGAEIADIILKIDGSRLSPKKHFSEYELSRWSMFTFSLTGDFFLLVIAGKGIIPGRLKFYVDYYKQQLTASL